MTRQALDRVQLGGESWQLLSWEGEPHWYTYPVVLETMGMSTDNYRGRLDTYELVRGELFIRSTYAQLSGELPALPPNVTIESRDGRDIRLAYRDVRIPLTGRLELARVYDLDMRLDLEAGRVTYAGVKTGYLARRRLKKLLPGAKVGRDLG